jgi:hypothetical protein
VDRAPGRRPRACGCNARDASRAGALAGVGHRPCQGRESPGEPRGCPRSDSDQRDADRTAASSSRGRNCPQLRGGRAGGHGAPQRRSRADARRSRPSPPLLSCRQARRDSSRRERREGVWILDVSVPSERQQAGTGDDHQSTRLTLGWLRLMIGSSSPDAPTPQGTSWPPSETVFCGPVCAPAACSIYA